MRDFKYVVIGAGMTAHAAVKGIREVDTAGAIAVIGDEPDPPYNRPPLTKSLWKGKAVDSIWCNIQALGAELCLERRAVRVSTASREVTDDRGEVYTYAKLLLATGASPRRLPYGGRDILYYRTLQDYRRLRELADRGNEFLVIGGGFIGSEIAAALAMNGKHVSMVLPEAAVGARMFPADLALYLNRYYETKGVDVLCGLKVSNIARKNGGYLVKVEDGRTLVVDAVVAGIGVQPNAALAADAGIETEDGIPVDDGLETSQPDIYAAGDVALFYSPLLDRRLRVEHEDNAKTMGTAAGRCMAGEKTPYRHLPYFYSDLFDLGYEAIGETDPHYETITLWKEPYRKGTIFYLKRGRVRGIVLWNVWKCVDAGRQLLGEPGPFDETRLKEWVASLPDA